MRLSHVEAAVLVAGGQLAAAERLHGALAACLARVFALAAPGVPTPPGVERIEVREDAGALERVCAALAACKAHALLAARADAALEAREALALLAGMPACGGPELVVFEREARAQLDVAVFRVDALARLRGLPDLESCASALDALLVPAHWLSGPGG